MTAKRDRPTNEIEVTEAMRKAGAEVIWEEGPDPSPKQAVAERVFRAMLEARGNPDGQKASAPAPPAPR